MPEINQEQFLELIGILASSSWAYFEVKVSEYLGIGYESLSTPLQELKKLPDRISELRDKLDDEITVSRNRKEQLTQSQVKVGELESELQTERETTQQALRTSQEWHERQKGEIIAEWKEKLTNLINSRKEKIREEITLLKEILSHE